MSTFRGAQVAIATKWCYVVYNKASRTRGERASPRMRTGAGEAEQQPPSPGEGARVMVGVT
jgi:hypothetical protein